MARQRALFLMDQEQPHMRSGIIAATTPASRVRTICRCKNTPDLHERARTGRLRVGMTK
jgi:hypothetical protein